MVKSDKNAKKIRGQNVFTADLCPAKFGMPYFFRQIFGGQILGGEFGNLRQLRALYWWLW